WARAHGYSSYVPAERRWHCQDAPTLSSPLPSPPIRWADREFLRACLGMSSLTRVRVSFALEIKLQTCRQGSLARQLIIQVQRIQPIILIGNVQQTYFHLGDSVGKSVTGKQVQLPKIIAGDVRSVAAVRLNQPDRIELA